MASEVLISISRDEVERARLMSEYKYVTDHQSKLVQAKRQTEKRIREEDHQEFLALLNSGKSLDEIRNFYENNH